MKKKIIIAGVILLLAGLTLGAPASYAGKTPYTIGIAVDLTGRAAGLGVPEMRVYKMLAEDINKAGGINGRPLKLIILDNESKPAKAVLNTKRLINVDHVIAVLGYSTSGSTLACVQAATSGRTVLFSNAASSKIWRPTKKWIFNVVPCQRDASTPLLVEDLLKKGAKKIAYIYIDTAYGQTGKATFLWACKKKGLTPALIEKYRPGVTDLSPQITHIKKSGADGLIVCGYMGDTAKVLKTAREQGFSSPIDSEYAVVGPEFIKLAGKYAEGVVSTSLKALVAHELPDSDAQKKIAVELYDRYTKKYGTFSLYSGHAWDTLMMTKLALEKVGAGLDPSRPGDLKKIRAQLRDHIEALKNVVGQNGIFNYSKDNHNGLSYGCYVPVVVKNGAWRLAETSH